MRLVLDTLSFYTTVQRFTCPEASLGATESKIGSCIPSSQKVLGQEHGVCVGTGKSHSGEDMTELKSTSVWIDDNSADSNSFVGVRNVQRRYALAKKSCQRVLLLSRVV